MSTRLCCAPGLALALLLAGGAEADLQVEVAAGPDPARPGERLDIEITVVNTGPRDRADVTVLLDIPAGLSTFANTLFPGACPGGTCTAGEQATFEIASLPAGRGTSFMIPARVVPGANEGIEIPFDVEVWDDDIMEDTATSLVTTDTLRPVELMLVADRDPVAPEETLTYLVTYGILATGAPSSQAVITLPLPAGTTFAAASHGGTLVDGTVTWMLGDLQPAVFGELRAEVTVDAGVGAATVLTTSATYADDDGDAAAHPTTVRTQATPSLLVGVDASPDPARPGETIDVQVTISNSSGVDATDVVLEVVTPDNVNTLFDATIEGTCLGGTCTAAEPAVFDVGTLAAGAGVTYTLPFRITTSAIDGTLVPFNVSLRDATDQRREAAASTIVASRGADLAVIEDRDPAAAGEVVRYTLTYGATAASAGSATLAMPIPSGTTFVAADRGGILADGIVTWALGDLDAGANGQRGVTLLVDGDAAPGTFVLAEASLTNGAGLTTRHGTTTRIEAAAPLEFTMTASPDPAQPGETLDVELVVMNRGTVDRHGVTMVVEIPDNFMTLFLAVFDGTCPGGTCTAAERATLELGTIAAGRGRSLTIPFRVATGTPNGTVIPIEATLIDDEGARRDAGASISVDANRGLELSVVETDEPVAPGDRLVYTLTYGVLDTSLGATNAALRFPLPAGTTFQSATDGGELDEGDVVWMLGDVTAGAGGDRRVVVHVDDDVERAIVAGSARFETDTAGVRHGTTTRLESEPTALDVEVNANPNPADPGAVLGVTLSVTNNTAFTQTDVVLLLEYTDDLDPLFDAQHDGTCPGSSCTTGERAEFTIAALDAGEMMTFPIPPPVTPGATPGTVLRFDALATDATGRHSRDRDAVMVGGAFDRANGGDVTNDGVVGFTDLLAVLAAWGPCSDADDCPQDVDGTGGVGFTDLLLVLSSWD